VLIPLGTDRPLSRPTVVNHVLIGVNIAIFLMGVAAERFAPQQWDAMLQMFALHPARLAIWTFLTYAFLHGGLMHLLGNMVFLWVFGPNVEDRLGRLGYLAFYLAGAAAAGGLHVIFETAPVVGASGAIAAVTGAYLVLFPRTRIKTLWILILIGIFEIPAWWFIGGQIVFNLFLQATGASGRIATLAHLGGYGFGFGVAMLLLATGLLRREVYDMFSLSKHAARRRQFRELSYQRQKAIREGKNPELALKPKLVDDAVSDAIAKLRADVSERLEQEDPAGAIAAYKQLLNEHRGVAGSGLLPRRTQYDIANALFAAGEHQTAAIAYELFLSGYPTDPEAPVMQLMLGVISARYLNDPVRAKQEVSAALPRLPDGHRGLAKEILAELG
jgi:membrane associated rhomboid family serine protease/TolA-binding protein